MKLARLSLVTLLLTSPITALVLPIQVAQAQEVTFPNGIEELLPGEPSLADGSTQATYYFLLLNKDGSPMTGVTGKTSLSAAKGILKSEGNGIYSTILIPEAVSRGTNDFVQLNARTANRKTIKKSFPVRLIPKTSGSISMSASPEEITLGQDDFVTIKIQTPDELSGDKLKLTVSTGKVENLVSLGNGQYSARYIPPGKKTFPHIAVFTLASLTHPEIKSHLVLKQKGKANFAVNTNPNSNVIIRIDGRDFGPVQTDASGKASVPIVAPPGHSDATLIVISNEERKEELLDLRIPRNVPRFNIVPTLSEIPGDGVSSQKVYIYIATAKGDPDTRANVTCKASLGKCGTVKSIGDGYYEVDYTAPLANAKQTENLKFILQDPSGDILSSGSFTILPVLPGKVSLKAADTTLPKNVPNFGLTIQVKDDQGKGLENRSLIVVANGAKMLKSPVSLGSGDYTVKLSPTTDSPIEVTTSVKGSASTNPPFGIAMRPNYDRLTNDGVSSSLLTFVVYDRFGLPVVNQSIDLTVEGGGQLPNKTQSDGAGLAQVTYTAGTQSGLVRIKAATGDLSSEFVLFLAPAEQLESLPALKRSQNQFHQRLQDRLFQSINHIRFEREGMEGVALTGQVDKVGTPSSIGLKAEPNKVAQGGKTTVNISLTDIKGRGVSGEELTVMASSGSIGKLQDLGSGQYSVTLVAPEKSGNLVTVVVETLGGDIRKELQIEVIGDTTTVATTTSVETSTSVVADADTEKQPNEPTEKAKKEKKVKKEKKPREPKERTPRNDTSTPWLRTSLGYTGGSFNYQQLPTSTTGILYEKAITFNRETEGSAPALTAGFDARAVGTVPSMNYLGYDVHVQSDYYSIALNEFPEAIGDWMTSIDATLAGQYQMTMGGLTVTPSVRVGLLRDDLIIFRQNIQDDGNIELTYEPLFVTALNLGLGTDVYSDAGVFGHLTYDMGIRGSIYRHKLEIQTGYDITDTFYAFVGARSTVRNVDVETSSGKAGEIHDGNYSFVTGLGGVFR